MIKQLTKAEEQIMQVLWKQEKAYLKDIIDNLPQPTPHSNTVATIVKILIEKEKLNSNVFLTAALILVLITLIGGYAYIKTY